MKKWQIKNNNWFKKNQYSILFERLFFFQTKYYFKNFKRIDNFFVDKFNEKFFSTKNEIDRLMKNHVRNFTSKTKMIYCVNNEIDQYLKFFQHRMKNLLSSYFWQFVLIYINDIIIYFFSLNQHVSIFESNFHSFWKQRRYFRFRQMSFCLF